MNHPRQVFSPFSKLEMSVTTCQLTIPYLSGIKSVGCDSVMNVHVSVLPLYLVLGFIVLTVNDTLDDIMDESGDEEEQEAIVNQVLDEIGIDISGKVNSAYCTVYVLVSFKRCPQTNAT